MEVLDNASCAQVHCTVCKGFEHLTILLFLYLEAKTAPVVTGSAAAEISDVSTALIHSAGKQAGLFKKWQICGLLF